MNPDRRGRWVTAMVRAKNLKDGTKVLLLWLHLNGHIKANGSISVPRNVIAEGLGIREPRVSERFADAVSSRWLDHVAKGRVGITAVYAILTPQGTDSRTLPRPVGPQGEYGFPDAPKKPRVRAEGRSAGTDSRTLPTLSEGTDSRTPVVMPGERSEHRAVGFRSEPTTPKTGNDGEQLVSGPEPSPSLAGLGFDLRVDSKVTTRGTVASRPERGESVEDVAARIAVRRRAATHCTACGGFLDRWLREHGFGTHPNCDPGEPSPDAIAAAVRALETAGLRPRPVEDIDPEPGHLDGDCPTCGTPTPRPRVGRNALCRPCTAQELAAQGRHDPLVSKAPASEGVPA